MGHQECFVPWTRSRKAYGNSKGYSHPPQALAGVSVGQGLTAGALLSSLFLLHFEQP